MSDQPFLGAGEGWRSARAATRSQLKPLSELWEAGGNHGIVRAVSAFLFDHDCDIIEHQQQRVAIARGLAYQPEVLLMDEPFASVDAQTRMELEDLLLRVRGDFDVTILFVTHDLEEAVYVADRVVVLSTVPSRVREIIPIPFPGSAIRW